MKSFKLFIFQDFEKFQDNFEPSPHKITNLFRPVKIWLVLFSVPSQTHSKETVSSTNLLLFSRITVLLWVL